MVLPMIDWLSPIISCNLIPSSNPSHTLSATIYIYIQISLRLRIIISNMSKNSYKAVLYSYGRKGRTIRAGRLRRRGESAPLLAVFRSYSYLLSVSFINLCTVHSKPLYNRHIATTGTSINQTRDHAM